MDERGIQKIQFFAVSNYFRCTRHQVCRRGKAFRHHSSHRTGNDGLQKPWVLLRFGDCVVRNVVEAENDCPSGQYGCFPHTVKRSSSKNGIIRSDAVANRSGISAETKLAVMGTTVSLIAGRNREARSQVVDFSAGGTIRLHSPSNRKDRCRKV
jgi:hypothetical protein